ncbi:MAG: hypothetical protein AB1776_00340 [Bacillota bacterium]
MVLAQEKPVTGLPQVRVRKRRRPQPAAAQGRARLLALLVGSFACGLILVFAHGQVAVTGYRMTDLQREVTALQAEHGALTAAVSALESLDRVEHVATTRLGMVKPAGDNVLYVVLDDAAQDRKGAPVPAQRKAPPAVAGKSDVIHALMELVFHPKESVSSG